MLAQARRVKILDMICEEGSVRVSELSSLFCVSEVTIRQDLEKLSRNGQIVREHGGAHLGSMADQVRSLQLQRTGNMRSKQAIARLAATLVLDGQSIILDAGSTTTEIARALVARRDITVLTTALNIALELGSRPGFHTLVAGGEFKPPTLSLTGEKAAAFFDNVHVDTTFLATAGVSLSAGLTYPGFADLGVKRAMIAAAGRVCLVADSSKVGSVALATLGPLSMVHTLITDSGIDTRTRRSIEAQGVEVLVAHTPQ